MNLTFDPQAADFELAQLRRTHRAKLPSPVGGGRWYDGEYVDGWPRCNFCGHTGGEQMVSDHCHLTGLVRGRLCAQCNNYEGRGDSPALDAWRLTAPRLTVGRREFYCTGWSLAAGREGLAHSTEDELLTLPIGVLLERGVTFRHESTPAALVEAAVAMDRLLGGSTERAA